MAENARTRELIENAVAEVFDQHVRALHDDVVVRVMSTLETLEKARTERPKSAWLKSAVELVENSSQQTDILKALLQGAERFATRTALFVLRGSTGVVWQARGFGDDDALKTVSVSLNKGACAIAIQERAATTGRASEFGERFAIDGAVPECVVIPLIIRDKVAALLYGDAASDENAVDICALELLARTAGNWIEMQALRKSSGMPAPAPKPAATLASKPVAAEREDPAQPAPEPPSVQMQTGNVAKAPASANEGTNAVSDDAPQETEKGDMGASMSSEAATDQVPPQEEELHRKARRFAKLLVDEIILYNRAKVSEGRLNHDLYDRLKDDIDKSRTTYQKRFTETSVAKRDYFTQAVISGLAEHNAALLGSNFPR